MKTKLFKDKVLQNLNKEVEFEECIRGIYTTSFKRSEAMSDNDGEVFEAMTHYENQIETLMGSQESKKTKKTQNSSPESNEQFQENFSK